MKTNENGHTFELQNFFDLNEEDDMIITVILFIKEGQKNHYNPKLSNAGCLR